MTVNLELLNKTLSTIKARPEAYNQGGWVDTDSQSTCGTTMCFAGHAAVIAGAEIPDPTKHDIRDWYTRKDEKASYLNWEQAYRLDRTEYQHVREYAATKLGITQREADYLFDAWRTPENIEEAVQELNEHGKLISYTEDSYDEDYDEYDDDDY